MGQGGQKEKAQGRRREGFTSARMAAARDGTKLRVLCLHGFLVSPGRPVLSLSLLRRPPTRLLSC